MAEISKITLLNGTTYDLKDAQARADIADIQSSIAGGLNFLGETTTALADNTTTNPITINSASVTAKKGDLAVYGKKEFLFNGTKWIEMGDLSLLKALAYKDSASGSYTPVGTVSQPTFTGSETTSTGTFKPSGSIWLDAALNSDSSHSLQVITSMGTSSFSGTAATIKPKVTASGNVAISTGDGIANYTPAGTVAAPTISVKTAGTTTTVNSITAVGTLPSLTTTVANEVLTIGFDAGALPTKGANTTVKTGDAAYQATAPVFTGTGVDLEATFTGTEVEGSASYTPAGTVTVRGNQHFIGATFTGSNGTVSVTGTPTGTVSQPTFTGTAGTVTVT